MSDTNGTADFTPRGEMRIVGDTILIRPEGLTPSQTRRLAKTLAFYVRGTIEYLHQAATHPRKRER